MESLPKMANFSCYWPRKRKGKKKKEKEKGRKEEGKEKGEKEGEGSIPLL